MLSEEIYGYAIKYYNSHPELSSKIKTDRIKLIFGIGESTFYKKYMAPRKSRYGKELITYLRREVNKAKIIDAELIISRIYSKFHKTISKSYFYKMLGKMELIHKKLYIKKQPYSNKEYKAIKDVFLENYQPSIKIIY